MNAEEARTIGARARMIRRRRGLSLEVVAGLAGISKQYLSALERGQRGFNRRGLIEDLAEALGCSVADLTGQPYSLPDRQSADVAAAVAGISTALHDTTLDDVPDLPARPLPELVRAAAQSNAYADDARYAMAGQGLGAVLTELHMHAVTGDSQERQSALVALAEAGMVAYCLAYRIGHEDLAVMAARRGFDAAVRAERPDLVGMLAMSRAVALMRVRARRRAAAVCADVLGEISALPGPTSDDTTVAEACGTLHLTSALVAARDGRTGEIDTHLAEARSLAAHTGERNHLRYHFGPTNVAGWELSIAAEHGGGPGAAERFTAAATDLSVLGSRCREGYVHFALARCWAQAEGTRDSEALRALDTADRLAPVVIRNDPIARDLVVMLDRRARRRVWELDSLRNRFRIGARGLQSGDN
ncbi:MAG: helix-turn-helix domain-containing protein [Pseudonocardiaceae bacterium]